MNSFTLPSFETFQESLRGQKTERASLDEYKELYDMFLEGLPSIETPTLIIFAGGPGTGKTTYRKKHFGSHTNFHIHDLDEVMLRLQGYKGTVLQYPPVLEQGGNC